MKYTLPRLIDLVMQSKADTAERAASVVTYLAK